MLQNYFEVPLNVGLVDSLKMFIELSQVEVIDYKLITPYKIFYEETSEFIDEINPPKPVIIEQNGIKLRYSLVSWTHPKTKITKQMLCLTVSTKLLRENYFQGINKDNYTQLVDFINEKNIIKIDYETFLNATINDIDICVNYRLDFKPYQTSLKMLYDMVKDSKKHLVELFPKRETQRINENFGLTFNSRENALISSPFIKFYNKTFELINNSVDFYNTYIFPQLKYGLNINNLIRKETTIKNGKHKDYILKKYIKSTEKLQTLSDLFKLTQQELDTIANSQIKHYYEKRSFSISDDLPPMDKLLSYYMNELVNLGYDKNLLYYPLKLIKLDSTRSRTKKKLDTLIDITFNTDYMKNKLTANSTANEFIKMLELW